MIHKIYAAGANVAACGIAANTRGESFATLDAWEVAAAYEPEIRRQAERSGLPVERYVVCQRCGSKGN
jgi:hypothetical protein